MQDLTAIGANWVAIHPYAGIRADGTVRHRPIDPQNPPQHLVRPIAEARARGLRILIKPHLAYWGSPFRWRGEIDFDDDASWERFWTGYREWILQLAAATREADGFVVGTELDRTLGHAERWRELIAAVRTRTPAPLTYAANWTDFERVTFWDRLDAVGIQAYFPLAEEADTSESAIRSGWAALAHRLGQFSREQNKPILLTELGYSRARRAPVEPWASRTENDPAAEEMQQRCMRIALAAIEDEPRIVGAFLWKWFPRPHPVGRNFRLATPAMQQLIREAWLDAPETPVQMTAP